MNDNRHQFQIYLPGLLKVLAESLYSTKKVAIRELLQNAHDSCVRRSVEYPDKTYRPRVDVSIDQEQRIITIQDNGSGLSAEDVKDYLSTIGKSYTRELGENRSILSPEEANKLIGQFGMGFLSAFLVASEVVLTTRSVKLDSPTLQWRSTGDVHYDLTPAPDGPVGTTVELHVKPSASFMLNEDILVETIQQYADFIPVPIHVGDGRYPVNVMVQPWEALDKEVATLDYIARVFKTPNPLAIIHLHDQEIDLGHDTTTIPLNGFLFVPPSSVASIREYGDLSVFIRRMFICEHQQDLLPPWARFVRGLIDCPYLQPTASREEIHQDDTFISVQQALESQLVAGLRRISDSDPGIWKKIVQGHSDVIVGWAVQDNAFFEQIADIATFRTSRGQLNLPDYLNLTNKTIYYVTRELGSLQEQLLGEGHGVPVLDASWFAVTPFLKKYAGFRQDVQLVQLDGESNQLLRPAPENEFAPVLAYYRGRGIKARIVTFKPPEVPALIIYPKDAEFLAETRNALESGDLPGPFAGLVGDYLNKMNAGEESLDGTLYLNASCSLIQRLAKPDAESVRSAVLALIYQIARLFAGRMLDVTKVTEAFRETSQSIEELFPK